MELVEVLKNWYQGRYVPPRPNDPGSLLFIVGLGHYERPLLAKVLSGIARFYMAHWQWLVGTVISVIGILAALE